MKSTILSVLVMFALTFVALAETPKLDATKKQALTHSLEAFSGTWEIVAVQPPGSTKAATRLVFNKDGTYAAHDARGKQLWAGTFDLDPTKSGTTVRTRRKHKAATPWAFTNSMAIN